MSWDALDDAAMAALWPIRHSRRENIGIVYGDDFQVAGPVGGRESTVKGAFTIPGGSLRALFHNHTPSGGRDEFSRDDVMRAKSLKVPSYISAGDKVMRYDPQTGKTSEVLAQIPIEEIRRLYLVEGLKK